MGWRWHRPVRPAQKDSVGYEIGARYGPWLLSLKVLRRREERINAVRVLRLLPPDPDRVRLRLRPA